MLLVWALDRLTREGVPETFEYIKRLTSKVSPDRESLPSLPFDRVLLKLLSTVRLLKQFQVVNGHKPELIEAALNGGNAGTIIYAS